MATAKKPTTKKPAVKKAASTPVKKTTKKQPVVRNKTVSKKKSVAVRSFRPARDTQDFTGFRVTKQTVYWIILVTFIVFVQLWMLRIQMDVAQLVEQQVTSQNEAK